MNDQAWDANEIARVLARQFFLSKNLVVVPECAWTGHECDLLVVTMDLRVIDVEIKVSRADLKRDASKSKWWRSLTAQEAQAKGIDTHRWDPWAHREPRQWPDKVWKHYVAVPKEIWDDGLFEALPSTASGVLLLARRANRGGRLFVQCQRRATPCRDAQKISPAAAIDIARLASLRMWDSFAQVATLRKAAAA